jgi:murein DD-endopeptidase MepM/ murein hydrolase activator NlpD
MPASPLATVMTDTLRRGESLGELFGRHGIVAPELYQVITGLGLDPNRIPAGWVAHFSHTDDDSVATRVTIRARADEEVSAVRARNSWQIERATIAWTSQAVRVEGRVTTSVHEAMLAAVSERQFTPEQRIRIAWDVADVFAWQVDFSREIQPGDRIAVLVEVQTSERGEDRIGAILASRLDVGRRHYAAYRHVTADGRAQYFDDAGISLRRAFLRAPVEFRRIASGFSRDRFHPILRINRPHQAVDYAAAPGTPVLAAGEGFVVSANWSGNYGRMVELRHRNGITTRYAHLSGFGPGIRPNARVLQGDVIGFVGSSGLATAPHLHYEFRQNGAARDPARVDLGEGTPIPAEEVAGFQVERDRYRTLLDPRPVPTSPVTGDGRSSGS